MEEKIFFRAFLRKDQIENLFYFLLALQFLVF